MNTRKSCFVAIRENRSGNWPLPAMSPIFSVMRKLPSGDALSGNPPFGGLDEADEIFDLRHEFHFGPNPGNGFVERQPVAKQNAIGFLQCRQGLFGETMAFETDAIQTVQDRAVAGRDHIWGNVFNDGGLAADKRIVTNPDELVDGHQAANRGEVTDGDVARQGGVVGHDDHFSHMAIVGDVRIRHQEGFVADFGDTAAGFGPPMNGDELTDGHVGPDFYIALFSPEFEILGNGADGGKLKNPASGANGDEGVDHHMGADPGSVADGDMVTNDRVSANLHLVSNFGGGTDNCRGVNHVNLHTRPSVGLRRQFFHRLWRPRPS
ncbi:hypothetical protein DESC_120155 [Desulfosarcina cetonica]|nr:hypothetical protein DESC_120155 [Desulfosarcina cetonica]